MASIKYIHGDLLDSTRPLIAHGVNTKGGFGSGVAYSIARRYPHIRKAYLKKYYEVGWQLGDVQYIDAKPGQTIANIATQDSFGKPGTGRHVSYEAIEVCLDSLFRYARDNNYGVAIPKIGAGLGGGDWGIIETIIRKKVIEYDIELDIHVI